MAAVSLIALALHFALALHLTAAAGTPTAASASGVDASAAHWPQWRGPAGTGVAPAADPPLRWSEETHVRFKVEIPGRGLSTPVIWGDTIYLTSAVPAAVVEADAATESNAADAAGNEAGHGHAPGAHDNVSTSQPQRFVVLALDRHDGRLLWERTVRTRRPHESTHATGSWASPSAVTDGNRLFVSFGSQGLYALDLDGKLRWEADLGDMQTRHGHGEGSSPALHGNTLVVNWDHQGESFLAALDARDGTLRWKVPRDEITSWSTPLLVEHGGRVQVVVSATGRVRAYDLADGSPIWQCAGLSRNVVASPVAADGWVYVANSYDWQAMLAIRLDGAAGDITGTDRVAWTLDRHTPYVPSPVLHDGRLFFLKHNHGILSSVDARSGKPLFGPRRLDGIGEVFASPVAAAGRLYIVSRNGNTAVLSAEPPFEALAINRLDDGFSASPALAGDTIYLRGERYLYALAAAANVPAGQGSAKRSRLDGSAAPVVAGATRSSARATE